MSNKPGGQVGKYWEETNTFLVLVYSRHLLTVSDTLSYLNKYSYSSVKGTCVLESVHGGENTWCLIKIKNSLNICSCINKQHCVVIKLLLTKSCIFMSHCISLTFLQRVVCVRWRKKKENMRLKQQRAASPSLLSICYYGEMKWWAAGRAERSRTPCI